MDMPSSRPEARATDDKWYYTDKSCKHGHKAPRLTSNGTCRECAYRRYEKYRAKDPKRFADYNRAAQKKYYALAKNQAKRQRRIDANRVDLNRKARKRAAANPGPRRASKSAWKKRNPGSVRASATKRRAAKLQATPPWLTDKHWAEINEIYRRAGEMGSDWHVDHIVPLISDKVCGLHVPWNLRIISAKENWAKNNRLDHDIIKAA